MIYKTSNAILVPNIVYDLSAFIGAIVSTSFIEFSNNDRAASAFHVKANSFLHEKLAESNCRFISTREFRKIVPSVHFGSVIDCGNKFSFINYVTGSNDTYYTNSLCKSNASYEIIEKSPIKNSVHSKITLLDDTKKSFSSEKVKPYMDLFKDKQICDYLSWTDKEQIPRKLVV